MIYAIFAAIRIHIKVERSIYNAKQAKKKVLGNTPIWRLWCSEFEKNFREKLKAGKLKEIIENSTT